MLIARGVVEAAKDDKGMQLIKASILAGEDRDNVERFQQYGFTSVPLEGSEVIIVCPQGNREHMIAIAADDRRYRLKGMENGEVALYTDEGDKIHIKRGGAIEVVAATEVHVKSPLVKLGENAAEALMKGNTFQALFNAHTHVGNAGYATSPPSTPLTGTELSTVSTTE